MKKYELRQKLTPLEYLLATTNDAYFVHGLHAECERELQGMRSMLKMLKLELERGNQLLDRIDYEGICEALGEAPQKTDLDNEPANMP